MVAMAPQEDTRAASAASATGLKDVKNVVLCASCKGGVGKSTTSVNLAYSLQAQGHKVGILDVDIYGPSLPTMVTPVRPFNPAEDIVGNAITPVDGDGVKLMSMGYINPFDNFVLRGAKVSPLVQQVRHTHSCDASINTVVVGVAPGNSPSPPRLRHLLSACAFAKRAAAPGTARVVCGTGSLPFLVSVHTFVTDSIYITWA